MLRPMNYCSDCGAPVEQQIPAGDNRPRWVCTACHAIHYQNPKVVVGCIAARADRVLLCKRSIEPRYGCWTVPAGFMELGESLSEGAARETLEEACAQIDIGPMFASVDLPHIGQVHIFFTGRLCGDYSAGEESLEAALFTEREIPWDELAFASGRFALECYFRDGGRCAGGQIHTGCIRGPRQAVQAD